MDGWTHHWQFLHLGEVIYRLGACVWTSNLSQMQQSGFAHKKLDWFNVWCSQKRRALHLCQAHNSYPLKTHFNKKKAGTN